MKYRVGIGYDVHKLASGHLLVLGGVNIPSDKGSVGHSDADVALHAIIDAMLGAAAMRDIGFNYPDTDKAYENIDSKQLLLDTYSKIQTKGFRIENIDCVIALQNPKISKYIPLMQQTIAALLNIDTEDVSFKATTTEHLGFEGREEGVSAYSVCLLSK
ncbi:MAG: 2-C-methyl-D-erythritol 2,4-cyclodiphosphate synthase [Bacteroidales bacterium]|jgi:2-C-methyl-D-erythritol 2,4-cyclodiphosphate synthase|nr:2-C-methyl-D-erythritol 2,4-cyclodiphosphate synthase [Bacteroidales bacterium]